MEDPQPIPQPHTPFTAGVDSDSPEFEFRMVSNPSFPQPKLLSADQLFSGGFLLPLQHLHLSDELPPPASFTESSSAAISKRWTHIFKRNEKKNSDSVDQAPKERKRLTAAGTALTAAELNINLWPFSRSRSSGTGGYRSRTAAPARKVSSAPCSRSNSTGETKSRKSAHSPSRGARVHLGRNGTIWKIRRNNIGARRSNNISGKIPEGDSSSPSAELPKKSSVSRTRVLNLNVPMCIGYQNDSSDENTAIEITAASTAVDGKMSGGEGVRMSNLIGIRNLFTKKLY